ncbi:autophagy related lipase-like protein Atg15 [Venturia nashicola]|uniref:triacylglycerol lipase n=1 Tax=Venturia nashicola TaxID=86259 RepID=A0A4Z1PII6_9PEZI|nr:autophagy related lipase-like protein Atg15 [Venturia nashicola]
MRSTTLTALLSVAFGIATAEYAPNQEPLQAQLLPPIFIPGEKDVLEDPAVTGREHVFTLRQIFHHGTHKYPTLHRKLEVSKDASIYATSGDSSSLEPVPKLVARSHTINIQRLADRRHETIDTILDAKRETGQPVELDASAWTVDEVSGPNVTDKETILSMARVAANAYVTGRDNSEWLDVGGGFNYTEDFGWENDGLRGHIFADTENSTIVIGLKGTSPAVFDGSDTTTNDKVNDNLFFSCCCGQGGQLTWHQVCDCQTSAYKCNSTCVTEALKNKNRYYYAAQEIYRNVTALYPEADIWLVGHSLGGSTSSLVALTYGLPVVTFEAPGEAMPAARLGLPTPPGYRIGSHQERPQTGGYHFGHTADPIYMGSCNTFTSVCTIAGYAMQSQCHTGFTCSYDTVGDLGWRSSSSTHRIVSVIKDVIEKYDEPAKCELRANCTDCYAWKYFESNHTDTTTSSSTSVPTSTATRTATCKTPGWWGCLDESTTSNPTSTVTTTTTSTDVSTTTTTTTTTSTCLTPGWFGCKDAPVTSTSVPSATITVAPTTSTTAPSTTCASPGWWGCNDPIETSTHIHSSTQTITKIITTVTTSSSSIAAPTPTQAHCVKKGWFGRCKEWDWDDGDGEWKLDL